VSTFKLPARPKAAAKKWYAAVIPDTHVGYVVDTPTYSLGAWDLCLQALRHDAERLTHVVFLGDFGNWESLSHWASLRADQCFVEEDVALVNARLDEVEAITKPAGISVAFLEGNHEAWASQFEAKYPALRDAINLRRRLRMKERGWEWVRENHFYALGDLHFTHGHVRGVKQPSDMIRRTGASVVYGHTHTYATQSVRTLKGEHAAWTMGCLASIDPAPPYARGEHPSGWVHGFGRVQVRANGRFQVGFRRIIEESWTELEDGTELRVDVAACRRRLEEDARIRERLREEYSERYYVPGGAVVRPEPHHGKVSRKGEVSPAARTRRARIVRGLPGAA
jgi:metallophosphoesterase superfamily enzyme